MKNPMRIVTVAAALLFAACAGTTNTPPVSANINTQCLVSGEALDANSPTVDYMGKKVGFCCKNCIAKWEKMSDADKQAKLATTK